MTMRVKEALKNVAMQVAALNPKYVSTDDVRGRVQRARERDSYRSG